MKMRTLCALSMTALSLVFTAPDSVCAADGNNAGWDKVFTKSDNVDVKKVTFKNRFGIELIGDLYEPKNKPEGQMQAIAVSGPFGAVKEQSSGLYAQTLYAIRTASTV